MRYLDIKVSAIFATTAYFGHQEDAGTDNYRTTSLLRIKLVYGPPLAFPCAGN